MSLENYMNEVTDEIAELEKQQQKEDDNMENNNTEKTTLFPSLEADYEDIYDINPEYDRYNLADIGDSEEFAGKPFMTDVQSFTIDEDGDEVTKYRSKLYITNDEDEEYLEINLNLKADGDNQVNIRKGSVMFDLLGSIKDLEMPGWTTEFNRIKKVNLKDYRNFINDLSYMKIRVVERTGKFTFYSFIVKDVKL